MRAFLLGKHDGALSGKYAVAIGAALLTIVHFVVLMYYFEPAFSTPDANGYFTQARLIAETGKSYTSRESDVQFVESHWSTADDGHIYSYYPSGFPALVAPVYRLLGWKAALYINPILASATVLLVFLIGSVWSGNGYGLAAALIVALNPVMNDRALAADAHSPTVFFLMLAIALIVGWERSQSAILLFLSGLSMGIVPTARYPEIVIAPAFILFVLIDRPERKRAIGDTVIWAAGCAVPLILLAVRNQIAFGSFLTTGYTAERNTIGFGLSYLVEHAPAYLSSLAGTGAGVMFGLGVAGIAYLAARKETRRRGLFLAAYCVPIILLYMSYFWSAEMGAPRFLTPVYPVLAIAGMSLVGVAAGENKKAGVTMTVTLIIVFTASNLAGSSTVLSQSKRANASLYQVASTLISETEPGAVVIASETVEQFLDYIGYWKLAVEPANTGTVRGNRPFSSRGMRGGAFMGNGENAPGPGGSGKRLSGDDYVNEIAQWAGKNGKAYILCQKQRLDSYRELFGNVGSVTVIAEINTGSDEDTIGNRDGMGNGFPGPRGGFGGRDRRMMNHGSGETPGGNFDVEAGDMAPMDDRDDDRYREGVDSGVVDTGSVAISDGEFDIPFEDGMDDMNGGFFPGGPGGGFEGNAMRRPPRMSGGPIGMPGGRGGGMMPGMGGRQSGAGFVSVIYGVSGAWVLAEVDMTKP